MSIRTLIRIVALSVGLLISTPLTWPVAGVVPLLGALALLGVSLGYLVLLPRGDDLTRWQLHYHLPGEAAQENTDRLERVLHFLAERTGHFVLEANAQGLFLEVPPAYGRYLEAQLPRALPEVKLSKEDGNGQGSSASPSFLLVGQPIADVLRWATEDTGREVRLHIHSGPYATLIAQTDGSRPPGRWVWLPLPRLLRRLWYHLPLWDDLSFSTHVSSLLPRTDEVTVYSSRSRLHSLIPPDEYTPTQVGRPLGESTDARPLILGYDVPLFTTGAPAAFLAQQALADLEASWAVLVVSPHCSVLDRIARQTKGVPVRWLDPGYAHRSVHLPLVGAGEWETDALDVETVVRATETFLADLGVEVALPTVGDFCRRLLRALAMAAHHAGQDLSFTDLYTLSRSTQALRTFLTDMHGFSNPYALELLARLDDDAGYVQAVTILSTIRTALAPLETGPLHALCQPPFLNLGRLLREGGLLLVPMTDTDFPRHDRLLSAMLDLTLHRALVSPSHPRLSLHLHDPHLYRDDRGQRWIDAAGRDPHLSLLLDVQKPDIYAPREGGQIAFRCSNALASSLIDDWHLPASVADLTELPTCTGIARLPDMLVTLRADCP